MPHIEADHLPLVFSPLDHTGACSASRSLRTATARQHSRQKTKNRQQIVTLVLLVVYVLYVLVVLVMLVALLMLYVRDVPYLRGPRNRWSV